MLQSQEHLNKCFSLEEDTIKKITLCDLGLDLEPKLKPLVGQL